MAKAQDTSPLCYQIGDLLLDTGSRSVRRGKETLKVAALTYDLLLALAEAAPAMASYDQLADKVWDGRPVSPETIAQRAKILRSALSDDAKSPRYFELIRGQGYRLVADVKKVASDAGRQRTRTWATFAAISAAVVAAMLIVTFAVRDDSPPSVAVLPFADLSELGDQKYFADGISEEIINALATLDGLEVASRTESFFFRGPAEDLQTVGDKLNVAAILEGSIRKSEDTLRVTVQLIDIESGFHLWSRNFDSELEDVFVIQETIAAAVAGALGVELGVGGANEFHGAGTRNIEAYDAYLRRDYAEAIRLDPNYASAWARRSLDIGASMFRSMPADTPPIIESARQHIARAVELDPESIRVKMSFATIMAGTMNWALAEESYADLLAIRRDSEALSYYATFLMRVGRSRESLSARRESDSLKRLLLPIPTLGKMLLTMNDIALKDFDAAKRLAAEMPPSIRTHTEFVIALNEGSQDGMLAAIKEMPGTNRAAEQFFYPLAEVLESPQAAIDFVTKLADDPSREWWSKYENTAIVAAYLGYPDIAFDIFARELRITNIRLASMWYPVMSEVRQLPEFKELVVDIGLVDYWREYGWSDYCRPVGGDDFMCD